MHSSEPISDPGRPFSSGEGIGRVREVILALDPDGSRFARVIRETIDQLLDGQRTGRFRWDDLHKTEKTHAGTLLEINLAREFQFADGAEMDFSIGGLDVDCKFSQVLGGWEIPPEAWNGHHICLVIWASDQQSAWGAGLVRASEQFLRKPNRDLKRQLTAKGRAGIVWIWEPRMPLPENVLLHLDAETLGAVLASKSGSERIRQLFRLVQGRLIGRGVVATVAKQDDYMKRLRGNGGARSTLQSEGIVILGQYERHREFAGQLGLPLPGPGESVSARLVQVTPGDPRMKALLGDLYWAVARDGEAVKPGPFIPHA